ncbi:MAG: ATP synthase gamma chain [Alphaproteobacteria bacterium ADurb.Bin438]|nr:MAG: ATP synthase gamma chain [Alphaproteobacteria bacterium ADurb.Bin438]
MTIEALQKRIKTTNELRNIVGTMKSLSTASILQYDEASKALKKYNETIIHGLQSAVKNGIWNKPYSSKTPIEKQKIIAIIIGSDNGLVGKFNRDIISCAEKYFKEIGADKNNVSYVGIGKRIIGILERNKCEIDEKYAVSNSVKNISLIANSVVIRLDEIMAKRKAERVVIFYNEKPSRSAPFKNSYKTLLPIDEEFYQNLRKQPWNSRGFPLITIEDNIFVSNLIKEHIMMSLVGGITDSLKAEHHTRLNNMQAAEKNIDENLEKMNLEYQQMRQEAITSELLDVVSGSEALRNRLKKEKEARNKKK